MARVDWHPYRFAERIWLQKPAVDFPLTFSVDCKRKLTAVCSHQTRIGNLDAHLI